MLIKTAKYFVVIAIFIFSCVGILNSNDTITETYNLEYYENEYNEINIDYIATLNIPKISLFKVLYDMTNNKNNLEKNIIFVDGTSMPDEDKGNVIIAGHNGNSNISYFKDLNKLNIDDLVAIKYNGIEYLYKIVKKYLVDKDGTVEIRKDTRYSTVTLITCYGKDKQLVIIANLEQKK